MRDVWMITGIHKTGYGTYGTEETEVYRCFLGGFGVRDLGMASIFGGTLDSWSGFQIHIVDASGGYNRALQDRVLRLTVGWFALGRLASRVEVFMLRLACRLRPWRSCFCCMGGRYWQASFGVAALSRRRFVLARYNGLCPVCGASPSLTSLPGATLLRGFTQSVWTSGHAAYSDKFSSIVLLWYMHACMDPHQHWRYFLFTGRILERS